MNSCTLQSQAYDPWWFQTEVLVQDQHIQACLQTVPQIGELSCLLWQWQSTATELKHEREKEYIGERMNTANKVNV